MPPKKTKKPEAKPKKPARKPASKPTSKPGPASERSPGDSSREDPTPGSSITGSKLATGRVLDLPFNPNSIPTKDKLRREYIESTRIQCENSLATFLRKSWRILEPRNKYNHSWHIDCIADHAEAFFYGEILRLIITIPPRCTKSTLCSAAFPAWGLIHDPAARWIFVSYAQDLTMRDSDRTRNLIKSPWYQNRWGGRVRLAPSKEELDRLVKIDPKFDRRCYFRTTAGGSRLALSVGGRSTGEGGDYNVIDDPHNMATIHNARERDAVWDWWTGAFSTRVNNPSAGAFFLIMQMGHENDLVNRILRSSPVNEDVPGAWCHVNLPMEFDKRRKIVTLTGWSDPRTKPGELLCPTWYPPAIVAAFKREMPVRDYEAQFNQNPQSSAAAIYSAADFQWHKPGDFAPYADSDLRKLLAKHGIVLDFDPMVYPTPAKLRKLATWDLATSDKAASAYNAGQVWGVGTKVFDEEGRQIDDLSACRYLLDEEWFQGEYSKQKVRLKALYERHPDAYPTLIENKANGPAIISDHRRSIPGIIGFEPKVYGSKENRARSVMPMVEAHQIFLLHPSCCGPAVDKKPWSISWLLEVLKAPNGELWDRTDAFSQVHLWLPRAGSGAWAQADAVQQITQDPQAAIEGAQERISRRAMAANDSANRVKQRLAMQARKQAGQGLLGGAMRGGGGGNAV